MADAGAAFRDGAQGRDDGAKRRQILEGARKAFLAAGFDATSMNEVARAAGVSKGTLYVYFASKEQLFAALLRDEKSGQAEQLCRFDTDEPDVASNLVSFGIRFVELVLRPDSMAHLRTVIAIAPKFPEIGRAFFEAGPETGRRRLARYLDRQVGAGRLDIADTGTAAAQFFELCKSAFLLEALLDLVSTPPAAAIERHVRGVVDLFMRAYASPASDARPHAASATPARPAPARSAQASATIAKDLSRA